MREDRAKAIQKKTIGDYEEIVEEFSVSRDKHPFFWPEFLDIKQLITPHQKILDIGCGNGRFFEAIKDLQPEYYGVDPSQKLLNIAGERYGNKANFKKGDFLKLPFGDNFFDTAVAIASFHHIPSQDWRRLALREASRVLKEGGLFVLTVWNLWQPKYEKYIVKDPKQAQEKNLDIGDSLIPWRHQVDRYYHAFTREELEALLKGEFKILTLKETDFNFLAVVSKS